MGNIIGASLFSSILFFIVTNFGVWMVSGMYPHTMSGLFSAYAFAVPFFRNTIIGDLAYTGLFFGGYAVVKQLVSKKRFSPR